MDDTGPARAGARREATGTVAVGARRGAASACGACSQTRPDWCISRQRAWGVPIPAVDVHQRAATAMLTTALVERAAAVFEQARRRRVVRAADRGVPARRASRARRAAGRRSSASTTSSTSGSTRDRATRRCSPCTPNCGGRPTSTSRAATSTAAGSRARCSSASARAAARRTDRSSRTASSWTSRAARCRSRSATRSRRRTSSSRAARRSCACGWRWSTTARRCAFGPEILARVVEAYRKIRNTLRILVANLYDFDPATDMVPPPPDGRGRSVRAGALRRARAEDPDARTSGTTSRPSSRR